ncbi:MAG: hypothetical protein HOO99_07700 [Hyphomicrobiaceae bacterium]|nr:hypothetical protein [Hyphomicrobiaceae bacterium]
MESSSIFQAAAARGLSGFGSRTDTPSGNVQDRNVQRQPVHFDTTHRLLYCSRVFQKLIQDI